jgi:hypothetical protein
MAEQPAARRIMQLSTSGRGEVVTDNAKRIAQLLRQSDSGNPARFDDGDDGCSVSHPGKAQRLGAARWLAVLALFGLALRLRRARS